MCIRDSRATEHIPQIIALIQRLIDKGLAYESQGDVYYRVRAFPSYGCLCGQNLEDLESGARVSVDEVKELSLIHISAAGGLFRQAEAAHGGLLT